MKLELTQRFFFEAAHTLERAHERAPSRRVHGHTYQAAVTVSAPAAAETGMVVDLALLRQGIAGVRERLDHHLLDEVPGLGRNNPRHHAALAFIEAVHAFVRGAA